jgi:ligand-binding sensor protein
LASTDVDITRIVSTSILEKLPDAFYEATGISPGIHDLNGELVTKIPKRIFCDFCRIMYFSPQGHKRCRQSNIRGAREAYRMGEPYIYHCHAGLIDVSAPIIVNGHHAGAVTCGQLLVQPLTEAYRRRVERKLAEFSPDMRNRLMKALETVSVVPLKRLQGVTRLLFAVANNIVDLVNRNMQEKELNLSNSRAIDEMRARAALEKEIKNAQLNVKEAELKALQAQINPHFLYNTLDSIQWLAVLHGVEDIRQAVYSLGQLLRHSLDLKNEIVSIREEIEQVQTYLSILKMRYQDKLTVRVNIEEEVLAFQVPKLILQPLVENAILHGIEPSPGPGTVWIDGWMKGRDEAVIDVIDNGAGIHDSLRERIVQAMADSSSAGVDERERPRPAFLGLLNVHQRLIHYLGPEYGLEFVSNGEHRTCVRFTIPRSPKAGIGHDGRALDSPDSG